MNFQPTILDGCYVLEPKIIRDDRGFFMESFNEREFCEAVGHKVNFVQDNQSFSKKGVLRGLHYQTGNSAQAKLVRVLSGEVLDVVVDIRKDSKTFGKHFSVLLSDSNYKQLFIPRGFAHGFVVLSESAMFFYKCDNFYDKNSEGGIFYDDPELAIDWKMESQSIMVSEKDLQLPMFKDARTI